MQTLLANFHYRLRPLLDSNQSADQAGFRPRRSTTDHLFTTSILQETADEWQLPMWSAAVDFKKAFDSITHASIWESLAEQHTPAPYIHLLSKLYQDQTGSVHTDRTSRPFNVLRGTKQGDPLSSLLFNSVSESIMRRAKQKWASKKYGFKLQLHADDRLTNLRFADDILLLAGSLNHLTHMLTDLITEARKAGLELHPDKTKIMHNGHRPPRSTRTPDSVHVLGMKIEILPPYRSTKYLGRLLQHTTPHATEIENRIATAWRKFHMLKQELTGPTYSQSDRLRLFHGTVTPTILYGCEAWTLTTDLANRLRRTQRQMLRMIVRVPRRTSANTITQAPQPAPEYQTNNQYDDAHQNSDEDDDDGCDVDSMPPDPTPNVYDDDDDDVNDVILELWVDWIKRATHKAEAAIAKLRINDWVSTVRQKKWQWVRKLSTMRNQEWMRQVIQWDPQHDPVYHVRRRTGRPKTRWIDDIRKHIEDHMGCDNMTISAILDVASTDDWQDIGSNFTSHHM